MDLKLYLLILMLLILEVELFSEPKWEVPEEISYFEDEPTTIYCKVYIEDYYWQSGKLKFYWSSEKGIGQFGQTLQPRDSTMQTTTVILRSEHNNTYVFCEYTFWFLLNTYKYVSPNILLRQIKLPSANIKIKNTLDRVFYDGEKITISCKGHNMPENSRNELISIYKNDTSAVLGWSTHKKFSRKLTLNQDMRAFYCLIRTDHNIKGDNLFSSKRIYITVQNECGLVTPQGQELVMGGRPATHAELPWHAGIYRINITQYQQICGGSLVSPTAVISAAHCFWDPYRAKAIDASQFAVALGKIYRFWNDPLDFNVQKSDVSDIKIPMRFRGSDTNYQDDIAIVILATAIVYKPYIRPVCLDFDADLNKKQLQSGNLGKVAGWGLTAENGTKSQVLRIVDLPYVEADMCLIMTPPGYREYITSDKICAGWMNGTSLCRGDSGGGLVFPDLVGGKLRYYLRGLASTAPRNNNACNAYSFTSFTQIFKHEDFLKENFNSPVIIDIRNRKSYI